MVDGNSDIKTPSSNESSPKIASTPWVTRSITEALSGFTHGDALKGAGTQTSFPFRITAATSIETGRWKYTGTLQIRQRSAAGSASYANASPSFSTSELWNDSEEKNLSGYTVSGEASYGNGVIKADIATGFDISPIPVGMVVWAIPKEVISSGAIVTEWVFNLPNGISGVCTP